MSQPTKTLPRVLLTGDYKHHEFQHLIAGFESVSLIPINQIDFNQYGFDLIVVAQSMAGQFSIEQIERLQVRFPLTPIVALLGSWCEGESRTGVPWPGVQRVYWHQWNGRFDAFAKQLIQSGITDLHMPRSSTIGDQILRVDDPHPVLSSKRRLIGISAVNSVQFEMLKDSINSLGGKCSWVETADELSEGLAQFNPICLDAAGIDDEFLTRLAWIKDRYPHAALIVVASFPRLDQVARLSALGISQIVSKPYQLRDLQYALATTESKIDAEP